MIDHFLYFFIIFAGALHDRCGIWHTSQPGAVCTSVSTVLPAAARISLFSCVLDYKPLTHPCLPLYCAVLHCTDRHLAHFLEIDVGASGGMLAQALIGALESSQMPLLLVIKFDSDGDRAATLGIRAARGTDVSTGTGTSAATSDFLIAR